MEKNDYDGRNKNNKYNNNKNNINNKWRHVQSVYLVVNICIDNYINNDYELFCIHVMFGEKKTESERIEYINKRKWSKVFGIIIILMMDVS